MADQKPELPEGYIGPQDKFEELGLSTMTHSDPEITARDNHIEIKIKAKTHVKFTHQLINCRTDQDVTPFVFAQMRDGVIHYLVHMPESDYYKLQLYALPAGDPNKSLPNVYNYLIHCVRAVQAVYKFPKQYAQWKDGCFLYEPQILHSNSKLTNINWHVSVPRAKAVAIVADGEWFQFENHGGSNWKAKFSLDKYRGKNTKVTLSANFEGADESKFSTLLEYLLE